MYNFVFHDTEIDRLMHWRDWTLSDNKNLRNREYGPRTGVLTANYGAAHFCGPRARPRNPALT
jgi:hypothetical protein